MLIMQVFLPVYRMIHLYKTQYTMTSYGILWDYLSKKFISLVISARLLSVSETGYMQAIIQLLSSENE